jgi:hypothetical protein
MSTNISASFKFCISRPEIQPVKQIRAPIFNFSTLGAGVDGVEGVDGAVGSGLEHAAKKATLNNKITKHTFTRYVTGLLLFIENSFAYYNCNSAELVSLHIYLLLSPLL